MSVTQNEVDRDRDKQIVYLIRIALGMTQKVFGDDLGAQAATVRRWEWGYSSPGQPYRISMLKSLKLKGIHVTNEMYEWVYPKRGRRLYRIRKRRAGLAATLADRFQGGEADEIMATHKDVAQASCQKDTDSPRARNGSVETNLKHEGGPASTSAIAVAESGPPPDLQGDDHERNNHTRNVDRGD